MLWTDQLEVAMIEREQAQEQRSEIRSQRSASKPRSRCRDDQSVYKVEFGIGVLPKDLCGAQVVFLKRSFQS